MSLVVDASVVIKWFIDEPLHENARRILLGRESLHAPDLLISEVGNIAWKKKTRGEIEEEHARRIVLSLRDLPITLHSSAELIDRALQIALTIKHPVYDCLYLACAEMLEGTLISADERLKRALATTTLAAICRNLDSRYTLTLSAATVEKIIGLCKQAEATWMSIDGNDARLHLDTPVFRRIRNEIQALSEIQRIDLEALGWLGAGTSGSDWLIVQSSVKEPLRPEISNDLIYLVRLSTHIEAGWRKFQQMASIEPGTK